MMKKLFFFLPVFLLAVTCTEVVAQEKGPFPFFRSFLDKNLSNVDFHEPNNPYASGTTSNGTSKRKNQAKLVDGLGLQLTTGKEEVGAFYLPDYTFTTRDGLLIEFEYMFLGDATSNNYIGTNLKYGAEGAGFGYTHRSSVHSSTSTGVTPIVGMKGGYLAVALDQGHFKSWRFEDYEMRNGIPYDKNPTKIDNVQLEKYSTRSNVTIRGAAGRGTKVITIDKKTHTIPEGSWGFPVLITRHTGWDIDKGLEDENTNGLRNEAGFMLNTTSGKFEQYVSPRIDKPFNI